MKLTLRIEQDSDATSPSDWEDSNLFIVANHRKCFIPETGQRRITGTAAELVRKYVKTHWVFPLEAYIHSGVVLALSGEGNFPDRHWDVSQLGHVFAAKSEWRLSKSAYKAALSKVNEWNQYLSGDVWGCTVEDEDGNTVDSCWGFYGREYAESEGKNMLAAAKKNVDSAVLV